MKLAKGFTLIELMTSIGIFAIVLAGSWISYINFQRSNSLKSYSTQIISTFAQAQNQAMSRICTQNCATVASGENYSLHFDTSSKKITLFRGIVFNPSDNYNFALNLPSNLNLAIDFGETNDVVFEKLNGEMRNFDVNHHTFTLTESGSGEIKTFNFNRLGVLDVN